MNCKVLSSNTALCGYLALEFHGDSNLDLKNLSEDIKWIFTESVSCARFCSGSLRTLRKELLSCFLLMRTLNIVKGKSFSQCHRVSGKTGIWTNHVGLNPKLLLPHHANGGIFGNDTIDSRTLYALLRQSIPWMWMSEEDVLLPCVNASFWKCGVNGYHSDLQTLCWRDNI